MHWDSLAQRRDYMNSKPHREPSDFFKGMLCYWVWLSMATGCSGGIGEEGGEEALPSTSRNVQGVKSCP